ncbi:MAG: TadE family protein [Polymorphobacter sp.]
MEYAMVAPVLFSLMLGVIEYGFVFYGYSSMQFGANNAARSIAVNRIATTKAQAEVDRFMPAWMKGEVVTVSRTDAANASKSWILLKVSASAGSATPIKIFTKMFPLTLTAEVAVKQELPYEN